MAGLTPAHLLIVLVIALIVIGPGKLPEVGSAIGKSFKEFKKATGDVTDSITGAAATQPAPAPAPQAQTAAAPYQPAPYQPGQYPPPQYPPVQYQQVPYPAQYQPGQPGYPAPYYPPQATQVGAVVVEPPSTSTPTAG